MPQIIVKNISVLNHPIATGNFSELPGLSASILTGSGWITTLIALMTSNETQGAYVAHLAAGIDGAIPAINMPGNIGFHAAQYAISTPFFQFTTRPGAGQHIITAFAITDAAGPYIKNYCGTLTIIEHGF